MPPTHLLIIEDDLNAGAPYYANHDHFELQTAIESGITFPCSRGDSGALYLQSATAGVMPS